MPVQHTDWIALGASDVCSSFEPTKSIHFGRLCHLIAETPGCRGVVQLFNAVSKAQRSQRDALESGAKEKVNPTR